MVYAEWEVPIKLASEANARGRNIMAKAAHVRAQREQFVTWSRGNLSLPLVDFSAPKAPRKYAVARWRWTWPMPLKVTITRVAPGTLDDDNLVRSAKAIRDQLAELLGVDDRDARVSWAIEQVKGLPRCYTTRVRIEARS